MTASFDHLPRSHYGCILADPAWDFMSYGGRAGTPHRGDEDHYPTMTLAEMKALPVGDVAAKDCALFMWIVGSHIEQAFDLARAWGFTFKTDVFYWAKQKLIAAEQIDLFTGDIAAPPISMGYWTRKQVEPCWLFTRGKPRRLSKAVRQLIIEPKREHSRKPDQQYGRIEELVAGPRLEMFARTQRPGWDVWGNQTDKFEAAA